ncbi:MAG: hypothetical protein GY874_11950, partial [Desulfobacteraceae bacterium]|nr:hypothetical protein [Desulfobacteraceae bacterium]
AIWTYKVMQDGDWDHKPIIAKQFHPRTDDEQHYHLYGDRVYYYDVWSNIHYGYVGCASGFSESVLLDGAGLEQIGSNIVAGKLPKKDPGAQGLRAWDAVSDRVAVKMGIDLYKTNPNNVTASKLKSLVLNCDKIEIKPFPNN